MKTRNISRILALALPLLYVPHDAQARDDYIGSFAPGSTDMRHVLIKKPAFLKVATQSVGCSMDQDKESPYPYKMTDLCKPTSYKFNDWIFRYECSNLSGHLHAEQDMDVFTLYMRGVPILQLGGMVCDQTLIEAYDAQDPTATVSDAIALDFYQYVAENQNYLTSLQKDSYVCEETRKQAYRIVAQQHGFPVDSKDYVAYMDGKRNVLMSTLKAEPYTAGFDTSRFYEEVEGDFTYEILGAGVFWMQKTFTELATLEQVVLIANDVINCQWQ